MDTLTDETRKARKQHRCDWCGNIIQKGDKYPPLREAMIAFAKEKKDLPYPTPDFTFSAWLLEIAKDEKGKDKE